MTVINYHYNISGQDDAWAGPHGDNLLKMITCSVFFYIDRYSIERFEAKTPNLGISLSVMTMESHRFACDTISRTPLSDSGGKQVAGLPALPKRVNLRHGLLIHQ